MKRIEYNWEDIVLPLIDKYIENENVNTLVLEFTMDEYRNCNYYISRENYMLLKERNILLENIKEKLVDCENIALLRITVYENEEEAYARKK